MKQFKTMKRQIADNTNMIEKQFLGSLAKLGLGVLPLSSSSDHSAALEGWGSAIEYKDGLGPQVQ